MRLDGRENLKERRRKKMRKSEEQGRVARRGWRMRVTLVIDGSG